MLKQDDALPLRQRGSSKGPTAEDLTRLSVQKAWLNENINWKTLRGIAYADIGDPATGSDIVQELYHDMLQWAPEELQGLRAPKTYAKRAVKNRILNWRRHFPQTDPLPDGYENIPMEDALGSAEQVIELAAELPKEWAEPWVLRRCGGFKHAEIAGMLNLTVDAVKKRVRRADNYLLMLATTPPEPSRFDQVRNFIRRKDRRHDK